MPDTRDKAKAAELVPLVDIEVFSASILDKAFVHAFGLEGVSD